MECKHNWMFIDGLTKRLRCTRCAELSFNLDLIDSAEDEAFAEIERSQGWRKRQVDALIEEDMDIPMQQHREAIAHVRNQTLEEVAQELEKFTFAFGVDTVQSFAVFVRGMKE